MLNISKDYKAAAASVRDWIDLKWTDEVINKFRWLNKAESAKKQENETNKTKTKQQQLKYHQQTPPTTWKYETVL